MAPVVFGAVEAVRGASGGAQASDLVDALIVSSDAVARFVKKLKYTKRVLLITDGNSPADFDQVDDVTSQIRSESIEVHVVACGDTAKVEALGSQLTPLSEALGDLMRIEPLAEARRTAFELHVKPVRPWSSFKGMLEIGSLQLPVCCWRKVAKQSSVSFKQVSKAALSSGAEAGMEIDPKDSVSSETRYYLQTAPDEDIPPELRVNGYRLGRDILPLSNTDESELKYAVDKGEVSLLGFVPREHVPRHYFMDTCDCMVGNPASHGANKAVQALCLTLEDQGLVGIVRFAPRKNASPRLACLLPAIKCLYLCTLPFAEEVRTLQWPPFKEEPSPAQLSAAEALVDALDLQAAADGAREWARPKDVVDPHHHRIFGCIRHKALNASASLPAPDWRSLHNLKPHPATTAKAAPAFAAFAAACPTGAPEERKSGGKKRLWSEKAEDAGKKAKSEGESSSSGTGVEAALLKPLPSLQKTVVGGVDSGDPIRTFWGVLHDEQSDRTLEAFDGMRGVLLSLLRQAVDVEDALAQKGFRCLREMRRAAVQEEEPEPYNTLLAEIKADFSLGSKVTFWQQVGEDPDLRAGLISAEETDESSVSAADAQAFLHVAPAAPAPQHVEPAAAAADEDNFDDDFD